MTDKETTILGANSYEEDRRYSDRHHFGYAVLASAAETLYAAAAQTPAEQLYAELAKLKPDQRAKRLEEGARKEGKLTFVHLARQDCPRFRHRL